MSNLREREVIKCCVICEGAKIFVACVGCGMELCESCARFELIGSGCGCVWPVYYCSGCVQNPSVNPNAALREPEI